MNHIYKTTWNEQTGTYVAVSENTKARGKRSGKVAAVVGAAAVSIFGFAGTAQAANLVSACTGVSLPKSVVTQLLAPVTGVVSDLTLGAVDLNGLISGDPISISALNSDGSLISPSDDCISTNDGFSLTNPKGISLGGNQMTGLGDGTVADAGEINSIALGNNAVTNAAALGSIAIGTNASVQGAAVGAMALGNGATASLTNSVALGAGSTTSAASDISGNAALGITSNAGTVIAGSGNVFSVGDAGTGATRQIQNVAAGKVSATSTDAVNGSQLFDVATNVGTLNGLAVQYDTTAKTLLTLGGTTATAPTKITNLAAGDISSADSTDAVNGGQLYATNQNVETNTTNITNLGDSINNGTVGLVQQTGGAPGTGALTVGAETLGTEVNFTNSGGVARKLTGVADGSVADGSTDAVNGGQLFTVSEQAANSVQYDDSGKTLITLGGVGAAAPTKITNVAAGALSDTSSDAVNGAQLFATNTDVQDLKDHQIHYVAINDGGDTQSNFDNTGAVGLDAMAIGTGANTSANQAIAFGHDASSTSLNATAIGSTAVASAENAIAFGTGAKSDALNGTAIGANSYAHAEGTVAIGQGATANNANDVALGSGTTSAGATAISSYTTADAIVTGQTFAINNAAMGAVAIGNRQITQVADGEVSADSTDAVNGSQLFNVGTTLNTHIDNLGDSVAAGLGGESAFDATTGTLTTKLTYGGLDTYVSVQSVFDQIDAQINQGGGIKYFHANSMLGDSSATGLDSVAIGPLATATGLNGIALGNGASSGPGDNAIAIGTGATAIGSVAMGSGAQAGNGGSAFGDGAVATYNGGTQDPAIVAGTAVGKNASADASGATAVGTDSAATGEESTAVGNGAQATGTESTALGNGANASAENATALGSGSEASGVGSTAVGQGSSASADNSVALGQGSVADRANSVSVGAAGAERQITNVAAGTADTDAANVGQLNDAIDNVTTNINNGSTGMFQVSQDHNAPTPTVTGTNSAAGGSGAAASGANSTAIGNDSTASGANSSVLGNGATASADNSVALGQGSVADRANSVSVGAVGAERQITNVAAGILSATSTDAVNGSQLNATNTTVNNIVNGKAGLVQQQTNTSTVTVGKDTGGTEVNISGTGGDRVLSGVADGTASNDAATIGQLDRLAQGANQQIDRLDSRIDKAENRASAGIAAALATAGLPQAYLPGKSMFAVGGGTWRGESGYAVGLSTVSDNGNWVLKGTASGSSRGDFGGSLGVGYQW